jgi:hypothetical protein
MRVLLVYLLLVLASPAVAQEKFIGSNVDQRTTLHFKASDAAVQKMLPEGWEVNSPQAGPTKGHNLAVVLVDQVLSQDAEGKPVATYRGVALAIPAKKKGTDIAGGMVFDGLFEQGGSPGAYGVYTPAQASIERKGRQVMTTRPVLKRVGKLELMMGTPSKFKSNSRPVYPREPRSKPRCFRRPSPSTSVSIVWSRRLMLCAAQRLALTV